MRLSTKLAVHLLAIFVVVAIGFLVVQAPGKLALAVLLAGLFAAAWVYFTLEPLSDVVDMLGDMRKECAYPFPTLAMLRKLPPWFYHSALVLVTSTAKCFDFDRFAIHPHHVWFVVKRIDVARAAVHEEEDYRLRLGSKVRVFRC